VTALQRTASGPGPVARMKYYGFLMLVLASLIASVIVQGKDLFASSFFGVSYLAMSAVLVIGTKHPETYHVDLALGLLLIFAVAFISTEVLVNLLAGRAEGGTAFRFAITVALDYCALGFLRQAKIMKNIRERSKDERYGANRPQETA